jgi:glutathione synthase/RimK-type ligase-like ATP-grasp enzyme
MPPLVALATAESLPIAPMDSSLLTACIAETGFHVDEPVWSDASVDWGQYEAVVIGSTWDYHTRLDEFLAWVNRVNNMTRVYNLPKFIEWNSRKTYLNEMAAAGMNVIPTLKIRPDSHYTLDRLMKLLPAERLLIKPLVGAGAYGIKVFDPGDEEAFAAAKEGGEFLVQPYLSTIETEGEISMIMIDGQYSHSVLKRPKDGDFRVQEEWGGSVDLWQASDAEIEVASIAMAILPERPLYARVDLVWLQDKPAVMELELIEPDLYLRHSTGSAEALASTLAQRIRG